jgi:hypothetical protein
MPSPSSSVVCCAAAMGDVAGVPGHLSCPLGTPSPSVSPLGVSITTVQRSLSVAVMGALWFEFATKRQLSQGSPTPSLSASPSFPMLLKLGHLSSLFATPSPSSSAFGSGPAPGWQASPVPLLSVSSWL